MSSNTVLITGGSGFIGQELATALASDASVGRIVLTDLHPPSIPNDAKYREKFECVTIDLTSEVARSQLLEVASPHLDTVYLLHGIMSGAAEANLDLGYSVNLTATMSLLQQIRQHSSSTKVVYASVGAVFGPSINGMPNEIITETTAPNPQSSYGTQKAMIEHLLNDFSRRNLLDARICRLPTVMPRSAAPTGAASSFASDLVREPLNGRPAVLPISNRSLRMFVCSPRTVIANLLHARTLSKAVFEPFRNRIINLPGVAVSIQEILDGLVEVSPEGEQVLRLVEEKRDETTERIVASWPCNFDCSRAEALGFQTDPGLEVAIKDYYDRHVLEHL